jgi:hypothetical protein
MIHQGFEPAEMLRALVPIMVIPSPPGHAVFLPALDRPS